MQNYLTGCRFAQPTTDDCPKDQYLTKPELRKKKSNSMTMCKLSSCPRGISYSDLWSNRFCPNRLSTEKSMQAVRQWVCRKDGGPMSESYDKNRAERPRAQKCVAETNVVRKQVTKMRMLDENDRFHEVSWETDCLQVENSGVPWHRQCNRPKRGVPQWVKGIMKTGTRTICSLPRTPLYPAKPSRMLFEATRNLQKQMASPLNRILGYS